MKKKKKQNIILGVIAISIISIVIGLSYSSEQAKVRGKIFGDNILQINEDVKRIQDDFYSKVIQWKEGSITKEELNKYADSHILEFEDTIKKYDSLSTPVPFVKSVELFKRSIQSQIESDKEFIEWVNTNDTAHKIHSDSLFQEAFEYENAALADFNAAKTGKSP